MHFVYVLQSTSRPLQLYVGVTADLVQRLRYHNTARSPHTSKFGPWKIVYTERFQERAAALRRERQIKRWSRGKKEALIAGNVGALKELARRGTRLA